MYNTYPDWQKQFPLLDELMDTDVVPKPAEPVAVAAAMEDVATIEGEPSPACERAETAPNDGVNVVPCISERSPDKNSQRARVSEPKAGARSHTLETAPGPARPSSPKVTVTVASDANDLDAAYAAIPEAERAAWYERADVVLANAGMPEWMRITPTVKEMAVRLWVGATVPWAAMG